VVTFEENPGSIYETSRRCGAPKSENNSKASSCYAHDFRKVVSNNLFDKKSFLSIHCKKKELMPDHKDTHSLY
jgi:hypothetical protein